MNSALAFAIDLMVLTIGVMGSIIGAYVAVKIVRGIKEGRLDPIHLVADKGNDKFSLHKVSQIVGTVALTIAFIYVVTHVKFEDDSVGGWIYWLFAAYGTITILPQAWTNFLNRNNPPSIPAPNGKTSASA